MSNNVKIPFFLGLLGLLFTFLSFIFIPFVSVLPVKFQSLFINYSSWMLLFCILPGLGVFSGGSALYLLFRYRRESKKESQPLRGKGFAVTGLVTGIFAILFGIYSEIFFISLISYLKPVSNHPVGNTKTFTCSEERYSISASYSMLLPDTNIITVGTISKFPPEDNYESTSAQLICTNLEGKKIWERTFKDCSGCATIDNKGRIILCTTSLKIENEVSLFRLSLSGDSLSSYTFDMKMPGSIRFISETLDSNYLIIKRNRIDSSSATRTHLQKIKPNGDVIWSNTQPEDGEFYPGNISHTLVQTEDGNILVVGTNTVDVNKRLRVFQLNHKGEIEWDRIYTDTETEKGLAIMETEDGNFMVLGQRKTKEEGITRITAILLKIDSEGGLLWRKSVGWLNGYIADFVPWGDGGFLVTGWITNAQSMLSGSSFNCWDTYYIVIITADGDVLHRFHGEKTKITVKSALSVNAENCILTGLGERTTLKYPNIPTNIRIINYYK
ncbi:MAG: hypothetical protein P9X24_19150 [Candidatus Hatepunaea meridiana]|nr:hypothetical protein [Candidatus Hatepunaea meridiana]